jgi:CHAD domain-containing protein
VIGNPAEDFADALADLQDVLGDHQDAVVGEAWLRQAAAGRRDVALVAGELIAAERASAASTRDDWPAVWTAASRKKLRAWLP